MEPTPSSATDAAIAKLNKLIAAGASADLVARTIGDIVTEWASESDMDAVTAAARIETLWDSLSRDAADLREQISDAPNRNDPLLPAAKRMLNTMHAAVATLAAAHARLQG